MSVTVIGGVNNSRQLTGLVTVPVNNLSTGQTSALQSVLDALDKAVTTGAAGFTNIDTIGGSTFQATVAGAPNFLEITNTASTGAVTHGTGSGAVTLGSSYNGAIVQAPGDYTVMGGSSSIPGTYLLGAQSNVSLSAGVAGQTITDSIAAAGGNDTLDIHGNAVVTASGGHVEAHDFSGNATVSAIGNASVHAGIRSGYAGKLEFVNGSSASATVSGGAGSTTVFGGAAGGIYSGGTSGRNEIIGGTGSAFLIGNGNNDSLLAGYGFDSSTGSTVAAGASVSGPDYLFAGPGNETLIASSVTGSNLFKAGSGADIVSTDGSGTQNFFGGVGSATMTGSTQSGAQNVYFFGAAGAGGGNDVITNFSSGRDGLYALNGNNIQAVTAVNYGPGAVPSALVTLSDNTNITLVGVKASTLQGNIGGNQIV